MTKIFISYRRQDTLAIAGRIFDRLTAKFGADRVFMDIDSIPYGVDFHGWLDGEVSRAAVVLALIGPGWTNAHDEGGRRRLDNPDDFVRIEIESALRRDIPLIPVLIGTTPMPDKEHLPESLRPLVRRHAANVDIGRDFHMHMDRLITGVKRHLNSPAGGGPHSVPPPQPDNKPRGFFAQLFGGGAPASPSTARPSAEGRVEIDAKIVNNPQGRWFLPGAGKTEWFQDIDGGPEMVVAPGGSFMMGSPAKEPERYDDEGPQHRVTIAKPFAIGRHAVTRGQFAAFVNATGYNADDRWRNPGFTQNDRHPVVCVNWEDAQAYAKWLREKTGKAYRLPTEAEWEYVCRAGTVTPFWWGSSITPAQANYDGNYTYKGGGSKGEYRERTVPVESFEANLWGLYQVHGNVWEWCEDVWHDDYNGAPTDGSAWTTGKDSRRVLRGGSWSSGPRGLRSALRGRGTPDDRGGGFGVRLARTLNL